MELGAFSISLAVKDLRVSQAFYEKLGFVVSGGDPEQNWLIMANGESIIGLFQGMFDKNIITLNPGLNNRKERLDSFTDIRDIQRHLKSQGIALTEACDESGTGPASITLTDPDGNPILIDQFFARPGS